MSTRAHTVPRFYLSWFVDDSVITGDPYVWLASLTTGRITRRAPKNVSIARGMYDGPGAFADTDASVESHLAKIEGAAAFALRRVATSAGVGDTSIPAEVWRFLAWQAARTPGWMNLMQKWANEVPELNAAMESPPEGFEKISDRPRPVCIENPKTGERREIVGQEEFDAYRRQGWTWVLRREDYLEALHLQAWYFQVRHFPRLTWTRLLAPAGQCFITSDRVVTWLVDGYADTPPAALKTSTAQVVAPLTRSIALVGQHGRQSLGVTPREINRFIALTASEWVAGPTQESVEQALLDSAQALSRAQE